MSQPNTPANSLPCTFFSWVLVGLTGLFLLMAGIMGQWLAVLIWIAAIALMLPPLKATIATKLPVLRNHFLKGILWFILFCTGLGFLSFPPDLKAIAVCTQLEKGVCAKDSAIIQNQSKLYLTGKQEKVPNGTTFKVKLEPDVGLKQDTVKAKIDGENYVIELEPSRLLMGKYKVSLASDAKIDLPEPQQFDVWIGAISDLKLCDQVQQNGCKAESTTFVENTPTLYFSGQHTQLPDGTEIVANLTYQSEPQKSDTVQLAPVRAKVKGEQVRFEIQPKDLPIGSYELNFTGNDKVQINGSKAFTVWRLHDEAKAIAAGKLPESRLTLEKLSLCDRSKDKLPKELKEQEPADFDETKTQKVDGKIVRERRNFCSKDQDRFSKDTKTIGFQLDFDPVSDKTPLKIVWRFANGEVLAPPKEMAVGEGTNGVNYSFSTPDGFPKGEYELLLSLEAKNAKPIIRKFVVE